MQISSFQERKFLALEQLNRALPPTLIPNEHPGDSRCIV